MTHPDQESLSIGDQSVTLDPEAPEADAVEQSTPVDPDYTDTQPSVRDDVNEADAAEQGRIVEFDDDYR